ncbi:MAG: ABC-2 family transporter protein [Planctomycetes bacterium]|nr:ABC-2 family transporter protein [Planctomycetota bacterium]
MTSAPSRALRALPTLLRVGVAETVAYRAEFLVWILTSTQPLIMMGLWTAVARERPFEGYSSAMFVAYYLASLVVRQLTANWVAWQLMDEIRRGTLSMRLLRPVHPVFAYMAGHVAAIPFRAAVALPVAVVLLICSGGSTLTGSGLQVALLLPSLAFAWLISFGLMFAAGGLAFFMTDTSAVMNLYYGLFALFSGYLLPLDMLPGPLETLAAWLPFRFMLSVPVELMTRTLDGVRLAELLGGQLAWAVIATGLALGVWRAGLRRFEAVGT